MHAPHSPSPQPSFVPVRARSSRRTSSRRRMPGTSTSTRRRVDREAVGGHAAAAAGSEAPGRQRRPPPATPARAARIRSGLAGRSADPGPGRIGDRRDDGRRPDVHRQLADPLRAVRDAVERRLDEDRRDPRRIERGRDDVGREPVVEVAPVAQLDLLDRGVADRLERAALDLALGEDRVDDPADVVGGDDVADLDLAGVEVDVDAARRRPPSRRPGRRRRGRSRRRSRRPGYGSKRWSIRTRAVAPGRRRGRSAANVPPVAASTCSRRRRAAWISRPPTTIAVREATVGPESGT